MHALWCVTEIVLTMSHGNARVESGFSVNEALLLPNMLQATIVNQRIVYDHIQNAGGVLAIKITDKMLSSVRQARQRYHFALDEARKEQTEGEKNRDIKCVNSPDVTINPFTLLCECNEGSQSVSEV